MNENRVDTSTIEGPTDAGFKINDSEAGTDPAVPDQAQKNAASLEAVITKVKSQIQEKYPSELLALNENPNNYQTIAELNQLKRKLDTQRAK